MAFILVRNSNNGAVGLNRQQIQHSIVVGVGYCDRFNGPKIGRNRTFAELALALIDKDVKPSRSIDDRGIRIAVSVKISPDKLAHARDSGKGTNVHERPIPVVPQNNRNTLARPKHDIKIAIRFNVDRPCANIASIEHGLRQFGFPRHVGESIGTVLAEQAHTSRACKHEVRLEIVVEVELQNAFGRRRNFGWSTGERKRRAGGAPLLPDRQWRSARLPHSRAAPERWCRSGRPLLVEPFTANGPVG